MACNHNSRGWRAPADTRVGDDEGWRCVDCGLVLCTEVVQGDLRSPNGKRSPSHPEFCDRVATLSADWETVDGITHTSFVCGVHRRRLRWTKGIQAFDQGSGTAATTKVGGMPNRTRAFSTASAQVVATT